MLKVFAGLAVMISGAGGIAMTGSVLPLLAIVGLTGLECLVATLQAYVFTILTCVPSERRSSPSLGRTNS